MNDEQLIPFTKKLWETGGYEAAEYNNKIPPHIQEIFEGEVYYRIWDGKEWIPSSAHLILNPLMLRKKTEKVWIPLFDTTPVYETKKKCEIDSIKKCLSFIKAIEIEF